MAEPLKFQTLEYILKDGVSMDGPGGTRWGGLGTRILRLNLASAGASAGGPALVPTSDH